MEGVRDYNITFFGDEEAGPPTKLTVYTYLPLGVGAISSTFSYSIIQSSKDAITHACKRFSLRELQSTYWGGGKAMRISNKLR